MDYPTYLISEAIGKPTKSQTIKSASIDPNILLGLGAVSPLVTYPIQNLLGSSYSSALPQQKSLTRLDLNKLKTVMGANNVRHLVLKDKLQKDLGLEGQSFYVNPESLKRTTGPKNRTGSLSLGKYDLKVPGKDFEKVKEHGFTSGLTSKPIIAHELGHASGNRPGRILDIIEKYGPSVGLYGSVLAGGLAGKPTGGPLKYLGTKAIQGLGIGLLASSPKLVEEARASLRAIKGLRGIGTPEEELEKSKDILRKAYSTYLVDPLVTAPTLATSAAAIKALAKGFFKKSDYAQGLPDPKRFGSTTEIPKDKILQYVQQLHNAERAGPHYDVRFGNQGPVGPLYSWATKKELPSPGGKIMLYQQPLHRGQYAQFEGTLESGYGKGTVKTHDSGKVIVNHADNDKIKFSIIHKKFPEFYTMIRQSGPPLSGTSRQRKTQGGSWLLINTTPMDAARMLGGSAKDVGLEKLKYTSVPSEDVNKLFNADYLIQEKVDGASMLFHLLADKIEALSYRASKTGRPIIHTYRVFGPTGGKMGVKIPKELQGTILRGEVYGEREGKSIPPQELGGILNASVENSLEKQRTGKVRLKNMIFDVARLGKETGLSLGAKERQTKLQEIMTYLPKDRFSLPETAETPEAAKDLWERITTGKHPRTREGIVAWPTQAGVPPVKVKLLPESDVFINKIFPGEGKFKDIGAGGFEYSLKPGGETIGKVGTGFSDQARKEMLTDPESWVGRVARIRSQSQFPITGAHRAPSFIARHEDYPVK